MHFDRELTLRVFAKKGCNVSATCKAVGISRMHFYRKRREDITFAEGLAEVYESMVDNVESILVNKIYEGDTTALIFFLKTKAKNRGYVERHDFVVPNENSLTHIPEQDENGSGLDGFGSLQVSEDSRLEYHVAANRVAEILQTPDEVLEAELVEEDYAE